MEKTMCRRCRRETETEIPITPARGSQNPPCCVKCGACKCEDCVTEGKLQAEKYLDDRKKFTKH